MTTVSPAEVLHIAVDAAHDESHRALTDPNGLPMDSVVWMSAHLAAVEHVLHPAISRALPESRTTLREQRIVARRLLAMLRIVEQHHSGDGQVHPDAAARTRGQLLTALAEHSMVEHALLDQLADRLGAEEAEALAERYQHALQRAPTRPHPHTPARGLVGRLVYTVDGVHDRVMDTMDSRHVPTPTRPPKHVQPGRWGWYLSGGFGSIPSSSDKAAVEDDAAEGTTER